MKNVLLLMILGFAALVLITLYHKSKPETKAMELMGNYRYEDALALLNKEIEKHPDNASAFALRATISVVLDNFSQATIDLEKARRLSPDDDAISSSCATTLALMGDYKEALRINEVLLHTHKVAQSLLWSAKATMLVDGGRYGDALKASNQAIEGELGISPRLPQLLLQRAVIKRQLKDHSGALADLNAALAKNKALPGAYLQRSIVESTLGQSANAKQDLAEYLVLRPGGEAYAAKISSMAQEGKIPSSLEDIRLMRSFMIPSSSPAIGNKAVEQQKAAAIQEKVETQSGEPKTQTDDELEQPNLPFFERPLSRPARIATMIGFILIFTGLWKLKVDVHKLRSESPSAMISFGRLYLGIQYRRFCSIGAAAYIGWLLLTNSYVPTFWGVGAGVLFLEAMFFSTDAREKVNTWRKYHFPSE